MGKQEDTKKLIDGAKTKLGGLDYLILNHITNNYMTLWNGDMEKLRKVIDINFHAYVSLATYATPMLNESNGSIAVLSSFAGKVTVLSQADVLVTLKASEVSRHLPALHFHARF